MSIPTIEQCAESLIDTAARIGSAVRVTGATTIDRLETLAGVDAKLVNGAIRMCVDAGLVTVCGESVVWTYRD